MEGLKCPQPGCDGTIEGGFCNHCGLEPPTAAPVGSSTTPAGSAVTGGAGSRGSPSSSLSRRSGSAASRRSTRASRNLGLGLVMVPPLPSIAPEQAVLAVPEVPPHKRFCPNPDCHDGKGNPTPLARRQAGHCPQCGRRYSFVPTLAPGDIVAEQYEVRGCLAFGGLGWIYLARDNVLGRWVVLKGLLNIADESAAAAAVAERQFLAAVKHPNIVGIYNFVKRGAEGFIVMEYIGGATLKDIRKQRGPLPPAEAIAYIHRVLGAFAYLHNQGLVYCDFKPENCMLEGDPPDVKLIDMGGVRRIDDPGGDIYGTHGYSAPEAAEGPTAASDLYTVGRTLAVLLMDFRFQGAHRHGLPSPAEQEVLARHESLHRFLLRATAHDPDHRFQSAGEMAEQLGGVLREVTAGTGEPRPVESTLFAGDALSVGEQKDEALESASSALLPELKADPGDEGTRFLLTTAAVPQPHRRAALLQEAQQRFPESFEVPLRLAREQIALSAFADAEATLAGVEARGPFDWRVSWYRGGALLRQGKPKEAQALFDRVYSELPGEPAAQLAVGLAAEMAGDLPTAIKRYGVVSRIDPGFATAVFGLGRCLARTGKRDEAVSAYRRVPPASSLYPQAQSAVARTLMRNAPASPGPGELQEASKVLEGLALQGAEEVRLRIELLETALALLGARALAADAALRLLCQPCQENSLRRALEQALRQLARLEGDRDRQIGLVDHANEVRPLTWV